MNQDEKENAWPPHIDAEFFKKTLIEQRRDELREGLRLNWPPAWTNYEKALGMLGHNPKNTAALTKEQMNAVLDKALELSEQSLKERGLDKLRR